MFGNIFQVEEEDNFNKSKAEPNVDSERMEAGYNSLFQEDGTTGLDTYWAVRNERDELQRSPTSEILKADLHGKEAESINLGIQEAVLDPTRSMEDRAAISQIQVDQERAETPMAIKLSERLAVLDGGPNESAETDERRSMFYDSFKEQYAWMEAKQGVMDDQKFSNSMTGLSMVADIAQLMIPFVDQANTVEALKRVGMGEGSMGSFLMNGDHKQAFFDAFRAMPVDQRTATIKAWVKAAHEANTTAFMTNGLLEKQMVDELLHGGTYGDGFRHLDNFISWIDLTVFAKPITAVIKGGQRAVKAGRAIGELRAVESAIKTQEAGRDLMRQMNMEGVKTQISQVSPIRIASQTNPESGKGMFFAVVEDATEETAGALGGASKLDVVGDSLLPEFSKWGVRNKIHNIDANIDKLRIESQAIRESLSESSVNALTRAEMESASAHEV